MAKCLVREFFFLITGPSTLLTLLFLSPQPTRRREQKNASVAKIWVLGRSAPPSLKIDCWVTLGKFHDERVSLHLLRLYVYMHFSCEIVCREKKPENRIGKYSGEPPAVICDSDSACSAWYHGTVIVTVCCRTYFYNLFAAGSNSLNSKWLVMVVVAKS